MDDEQGYAEIIMPTVTGCLNIMRAAVRQSVRECSDLQQHQQYQPNSAGADQKRNRTLVERAAAVPGEKIYVGHQNRDGKGRDQIRRRE